MKKIMFALFFLSAAVCQAQRNNNIKYNFYPLTVGELSLGYERVIHKKLSVQLMANYKIFTTEGNSYWYYSSGFNVMPELRYYFTASPAPKGFFGGAVLYYSYKGYTNHYSSGNNGIYTNTYYANYKKQGLGGGLTLGYQFMTRSGITVELSGALVATSTKYIHSDPSQQSTSYTKGYYFGQMCIGIGYAFGK